MAGPDLPEFSGPNLPKFSGPNLPNLTSDISNEHRSAQEPLSTTPIGRLNTLGAPVLPQGRPMSFFKKAICQFKKIYFHQKKIPSVNITFLCVRNKRFKIMQWYLHMFILWPSSFVITWLTPLNFISTPCKAGGPDLPYARTSPLSPM